MSISLQELDNKIGNIKAENIKLNNDTNLETQNSNIVSQLDKISTQINRYKKTVTITDENGKPTEIEYRRISDNSLYKKVNASNADINGFYQTIAEINYDTDGITILETITYTLTFDANGTILTDDGGVVS